MLFDTHAHLSLLDKRGIDAHAVLGALFDEGFCGIIDVSLEPGDLAVRIRDFSRYPRVRFASGLWPHAASIRNRDSLVPALERELRAAPEGLVCALGEFGLDHHWNGADHAAPDEADGGLSGERELMELQLDLARRLALPVIIHSRDAPEETEEILKSYQDLSRIIHCFSYGPAEAKRFLDTGCFISFAGNLTYKNAGDIRDACKLVPAERLLLETDCPYLAPVPFRGKSAHPGMTAETYKLAAELRETSVPELAGHIAENVRALFPGFA
jgi:TatD DNase family protein